MNSKPVVRTVSRPALQSMTVRLFPNRVVVDFPARAGTRTPEKIASEVSTHLIAITQSTYHAKSYLATQSAEAKGVDSDSPWPFDQMLTDSRFF